MEKLPNDCLDVDFNIFESAKDFDKWCICIANAGQNLSYYVKNVLFKLRKNPQPEDRVRHAQFQKKELTPGINREENIHERDQG